MKEELAIERKQSSATEPARMCCDTFIMFIWFSNQWQIALYKDYDGQREHRDMTWRNALQRVMVDDILTASFGPPFHGQVRMHRLPCSWRSYRKSENIETDFSPIAVLTWVAPHIILVACFHSSQYPLRSFLAQDNAPWNMWSFFDRQSVGCDVGG